MVRLSLFAAAALAVTLSACSKPPAGQAPDAAGSVAAADPSAKPAAFAQCAACHSVEPGVNSVGPSLAGVAGRKAGTLAGFSYSEAMKASGKTWDDATLDAFLTSPMANVPGTRMTYMGQSDPAKRAEVIAYLKTLK